MRRSIRLTIKTKAHEFKEHRPSTLSLCLGEANLTRASPPDKDDCTQVLRYYLALSDVLSYRLP
jgi:hypothetical protein